MDRQTKWTVVGGVGAVLTWLGVVSQPLVTTIVTEEGLRFYRQKRAPVTKPKTPVTTGSISKTPAVEEEANFFRDMRYVLSLAWLEDDKPPPWSGR